MEKFLIPRSSEKMRTPGDELGLNRVSPLHERGGNHEKIMSAQTGWTGAYLSAAHAPGKFLTVASSYAALLAATVILICPDDTFSQSIHPGIHVTILNIRSSDGMVACTLFESPTGFPKDYLHAARNITSIRINNKAARCDFEDLPPGTYAIAVAHDENMNGKLDTNALGIPTEGYGFSNDAKGWLSAPSFSAASFSYDGQNLDMTITLHY